MPNKQKKTLAGEQVDGIMVIQLKMSCVILQQSGAIREWPALTNLVYLITSGIHMRTRMARMLASLSEQLLLENLLRSSEPFVSILLNFVLQCERTRSNQRKSNFELLNLYLKANSFGSNSVF